MPYNSQSRWPYPEDEPKRHFTIVTRAGSFTVRCMESELIAFQRDYIRNQQARGIPLKDIRFIWDDTVLIPLTGVR